MKKFSFIALVVCVTYFVLGHAFAQSPVAGIGKEAELQEQVGPALLGDLAATPGGGARAGRKVAVTTYHYDNLRTGWNNRETTLTPANVKPGTFGLLKYVLLDDLR